MEHELVINLDNFTGDQKISALTGKERGISIRSALKLDEIDSVDEAVTVLVPEYVDAISSSFFLGLFSGSLRKFPSEDKFLAKYRFTASDNIQEQIRNGIRNGLIQRGRLVS